MKAVVVTGVSTGIGRAAAADLLAHGYQVFGSVRRPADATQLQRELGPAFTPLLFDVTDEGAVRAGAGVVADALAGRGLWGLVNNAGIAVPGPLLFMPAADFRRQFEVNLFGALLVTQAFAPLLGAKKGASYPPGRIVNISSISGIITYPFMAAYAASKHALEAFSDGLRRELLLYGVDVIVIEPGSVQTPIWDKAAEQDASTLAETDYGPLLASFQKTMVERGRHSQPVEVVSRAIRLALESERPKTRYLLPSNWVSGWLLPRLPDRWFDRVIGRRLGLALRKA
ncbi:MAG: SDR family oxidoreductase [Chloroflexota bacterium]